MIDYHEAVRQMHKGNVVRYIGTANGNIWFKGGASYCMCRGIIFCYRDGKPDHKAQNCIVYDPDFRYELTGETVDTRWWYKGYKTDKETKSKLGYSRIGLGNV
jgi:hypothetical protein